MASNKLAKTPEVEEDALPVTSLQVVDDVEKLAGMQAAMEENGETFTVADLKRLQVPSGSSAAVFSLENIKGVKSMPEVDCVLIDQQAVNVYFETAFGAEKTPPTCVAPDGKKGIGEPGGDCKTCKFNQFGSAENNGKKCANRRHLLAIVNGETRPVFINVPPSSIKPLRKYLLDIAAESVGMSKCVTRITLEKDKNSTGLAFYTMNFEFMGMLDDEQAAKAQQYKDAMQGVLKSRLLEDPTLTDNGLVDVTEYVTAPDEPYVDGTAADAEPDAKK